jgi:hypothetical protein
MRGRPTGGFCCNDNLDGPGPAGDGERKAAEKRGVPLLQLERHWKATQNTKDSRDKTDQRPSKER